ncbi:hypothetical protein [Lentzea atacamensis]|uniref:hypothetical protein n=1 Tax=Lentzea atacamensis TaxID=531938 RepID=UPI000D6C0957|nr:hypothetical protein [Lentzea atacamensis]
MVESQKALAAQRSQPVEWRIHRHHAAPGLAGQLTRAGFTEDEPVSVMITTPSEALSATRLPGRVRVAQSEAEIDEARQASPATRRIWAYHLAIPTWYVLRHEQKLAGVLWRLEGQDESVPALRRASPAPAAAVHPHRMHECGARSRGGAPIS